ncbi:MAG: hypothetical protein M0Q90_10850 [Bacteroidales bacterium]|nr:hypothetical protein [Bacteroidales bacterium]
MTTSVKKHISYFYGVFSVILMLGTLPLLAQNHEERVTIEGAYRPTIKDFDKIYIKPESPKTVFPPADTSISTLERNINSKAELELLSPLPPRNRNKFDSYNNFLMAGMGSRLSPLFNYEHSSAISRDTRFGLGIGHYSTWTDIKDYAPSDFMNNSFNISLDNNLDSHKLHTNAFYHFDTYRYYGFKTDEYPLLQIDKGSISQRYQQLGLNARLSSNETDLGYLQHKIGVQYAYLFDKYKSTEHSVLFDADLGMTFDWFDFEGHQTIGIELDGAFYVNSDSLTSGNDFLVGAMPYLHLSGAFYQLRLGLRLNYQDELNQPLWLYPVIRGNLYLLDKKLEFYAGADGGIHRHSYQSLVKENPWVGSVVPLRWENTLFAFDAGLRAALSQGVDVHLGLRYNDNDNSPFFITDPASAQANYFTVIYDGMREFTFLVEAGWMPSEKWKVEVAFQFHQYTLDSISKAWQKPAWESGFGVQWMPLERWSFKAGLQLRGEMDALLIKKGIQFLNGVESVETIAQATDLSLGADYRFSDTFSAYIQANNLLNQNYMRYYNYPVQGFQLHAGIKIRF